MSGRRIAGVVCFALAALLVVAGVSTMSQGPELDRPIRARGQQRGRDVPIPARGAHRRAVAVPKAQATLSGRVKAEYANRAGTHRAKVCTAPWIVQQPVRR